MHSLEYLEAEEVKGLVEGLLGCKTDEEALGAYDV
jgi:hypothetical protein